MNIEIREKCYSCYRPKCSCICDHVQQIETETEFVILMHPKEFKKTKNNTGHFTNLSLKNCTIFIDVDFSKHKKINSILNEPNNNCFILYPSTDAINLNENSIQNKNKKNVIFIIDSTWACSKKILRLSKNLALLPHLSFTHSKLSKYQIKQQPSEVCLSTIESTLCVLELLNEHKIESIAKDELDLFLTPFEKMVEYQVACSKLLNGVRYKV
ncbi:MAG: DTW domain-containing protein [Helicobacteraceae bacterium]|nr:DTW domain-containing protein [Helicobacteraceae bacterium]